MGEILRDYAHDLDLGAKLWPDVQKLETRWRMRGFTSRHLTWIQDRRKASEAILRLSRVCFERDEIDRMGDTCAQDAIREFERYWGARELAMLKREMAA